MPNSCGGSWRPVVRTTKCSLAAARRCISAGTARSIPRTFRRRRETHRHCRTKGAHAPSSCQMIRQSMQPGRWHGPPGSSSVVTNRCLRRHVLFSQLVLRLRALVAGELHAAQDVWRFAELNVGIGDDLDAVAPGIEEIDKRPIDHFRAGGLCERADLSAGVDTWAEMA